MKTLGSDIKVSYVELTHGESHVEMQGTADPFIVSVSVQRIDGTCLAVHDVAATVLAVKELAVRVREPLPEPSRTTSDPTTHTNREKPMNSDMYPEIGSTVMVRAADAGVHFGTLAAVDADAVRLTESRRLWSWSGEGTWTLSELASAVAKPTSTRVSAVADVTIARWCEVIRMADGASVALLDVSQW